MRDIHLPGRSPVRATSALAATSHPVATLTALEALRDGGNAIDAAVAAAAVLAVVEPFSTGIGGDVFCLYAPGGSDRILALNGSGRAPAGASIEATDSDEAGRIPFTSPHAVTVPCAVAAWGRLVAEHGKLDLKRVLAPAAELAETGYVVADVIAHVWANETEKLVADRDAAAVFLPGGRPPVAGEVHRQPALAQTLRAIGEGGVRAFYQGAIAEDMVAKLQARGGVHTLEDFAGVEASWVEPIRARYQGLDIHECPPNGQGIITLLMLNILSGFNLKSLDPLGPERFHLQAEAAKLAYRERDDRLADPEQADVPVEALLSEEHADVLRSQIDLKKAMENPPSSTLPVHRDTVYLSVVDQDRNAVSFINSLFHSFGGGIFAPGSGVMFHNRGAGFVLDPDHPNALAPGKRPMHTIIPAMATKDGHAVLSFGVMGGHYQPVGQANFLSNVLDHGMDVQEALDAPRAFHFAGTLTCERGVPEKTRGALARLGHTVSVEEFPLGGGQAIAINGERGTLVGGSDPRKDGSAMGF